MKTNRSKDQRGPRGLAWDVCLIVAGCIAMAISFRLFFNGNKLVAGGIVGLSTILEKTRHIEPALTQWGINIPLLLIGTYVLGLKSGIRSVIGAVALPGAILITKNVPIVTHELLLAGVFGGLVYGVGLGLVLRGGGSVGGWSLLARMLAKKIPHPVGGIMFFLDAATILAGAASFGAERAMYGLIAIFAMRRALDNVVLGFSRSKVALVISHKPEEIREAVLQELDRGLTVLPGTGGYTGESRPVLMIVLSQTEVPALQSMVSRHDPDAFVVITDAAEVVGKGFRRESV